MVDKSTKTYESPNVTEYGDMESLTLQDDKCDPGTDEFEDQTGLTGSIQDCEPS